LLELFVHNDVILHSQDVEIGNLADLPHDETLSLFSCPVILHSQDVEICNWADLPHDETLLLLHVLVKIFYQIV
jgi:hypothetical protein